MRHYWRSVLAGLSLPMLAFAASYGVYSFATLFVPWWVALAQAAAFELTYVGLAVLQGLDARQRRRAGAISAGAVVVSILYNTIAGLFHRVPGLLDALPLWGEILLAVLHGAPLAWVAFLVADLLLHRDAPDVSVAAAEAAESSTNRNAPKGYRCRRCGAGPFDFSELGRHARSCSAPQPVAGD